MKKYRVAFRREALLQPEELYDYIADTGSPHNAARYTEAIVGFCEELGTFRLRGAARDDIRPGLRTIGYGKRVIVAFATSTTPWRSSESSTGVVTTSRS